MEITMKTIHIENVGGYDPNRPAHEQFDPTLEPEAIEPEALKPDGEQTHLVAGVQWIEGEAAGRIMFKTWPGELVKGLTVDGQAESECFSEGDPFDQDGETCRVCGCIEQEGCQMGFKDEAQLRAFIERYASQQMKPHLLAVVGHSGYNPNDYDYDDDNAPIAELQMPGVPCWWFADALCVACVAELDQAMDMIEQQEGDAEPSTLAGLIEIKSGHDCFPDATTMLFHFRNMSTWEPPARAVDEVLHELPALLEKWAADEDAVMAPRCQHLDMGDGTVQRVQADVSSPETAEALKAVLKRIPTSILEAAHQQLTNQPQRMDADQWGHFASIGVMNIDGPLEGFTWPEVHGATGEENRKQRVHGQWVGPGAARMAQVVDYIDEQAVGVDHGEPRGVGSVRQVAVQMEGDRIVVVDEQAIVVNEQAISPKPIIPPRLEPVWLYADAIHGGLCCGLCCPKCGQLTNIGAALDDIYIATNCCDPRCKGCGVPVKSSVVNCQKCYQARFNERLQERYRKARKVHLTEYALTGNMIYFDQSDRYINADDLPDDSGHWWGFGTIKYSLVLDADDIVEDALSGHHDDASSEIPTTEIKRLQEQLDEWVAVNPVSSYAPDYDVVVIFDPKRYPATVKCTACHGHGGYHDSDASSRAKEEGDYTPDAGWKACAKCEDGNVQAERTEDGGFICPRCEKPITARAITKSLEKFSTMIICPSCAVCQHSYNVEIPGVLAGTFDEPKGDQS